MKQRHCLIHQIYSLYFFVRKAQCLWKLQNVQKASLMQTKTQGTSAPTFLCQQYRVKYLTIFFFCYYITRDIGDSEEYIFCLRTNLKSHKRQDCLNYSLFIYYHKLITKKLGTVKICKVAQVCLWQRTTQKTFGKFIRGMSLPF